VARVDGGRRRGPDVTGLDDGRGSVAIGRPVASPVRLVGWTVSWRPWSIIGTLIHRGTRPKRPFPFAHDDYNSEAMSHDVIGSIDRSKDREI
jgi:hypothetical protein